jgi:Ser/Thr protein kinase RdoA (MazF antagonist)
LFEALTDEDWKRLGSVIGRMHTVGQKADAPARTICHPEKTTGKQIELLGEKWVTPSVRDDFTGCCREVLDIIVPLFHDTGFIRIHGDCHAGNILDRPGESLLLIDFDDMMTGPAVQDLWLLLPDHLNESRKELDLLLEGYSRFREFDFRETHLIEPLRFMRIVYYLTWCALQLDDYSFRNHFPEWGTEAFWIKEVEDLRTQLAVIRDHLDS